MSKIKKNNCYEGHCVPSFMGKTLSVSLISHRHSQKIAELEIAFT